jgi:DNA-binding winged helix-turn-helix (wHTH) protein/tetratricopeptide (TPR) repeat protein
MLRGTYRFDAYHIDLARRELRRADELIQLSPMVFDCIAYLIEHRDRAVGRDELIAAVWGKADIAYSLLGQLMAKARRTIGGTGDDQRLIRTIPRFGYRWVGLVDAEADLEPLLVTAERPARTSLEQKEHVRPRTSAQARSAWLLLASLALAAFGSWIYFKVRPTTPVPNASLAHQVSEAAAILPVDVNAIGEWAWVRLGVMDLVGDRLRSAGQPVVPSENIVALARGDATSRVRDAIRDVTGARFVIAPSATRTEKEWVVRLTLESSDGSERTAEARNEDVTLAAREAADRVLALLGRAPSPVHADSIGQADELLARAKTALLSNDLAGARAILEGAPPNVQRLPELRRRLAQADYRSGKLESAGRRLDELLGELTPESDSPLRAGVLNDSGVVAIYLEQPMLATRRFEESLSLLAERDDARELGRAHLGLGIAYAMQGDYDRSGLEFSRARVAYAVTGDAVGMATVELDEGELEVRYNHFAAAKSLFERAGSRFERLGTRHEFFAAQASRIAAHLALLEPAAALAVGEHALPDIANLQSPPLRRSFQLQWTRALSAVGRSTEAREMLRELTRSADPEQQEEKLLAQIGAQQASLDLADGHADAALAPARRAVHALTLPVDSRERVKAWLTVVHALRDLGRKAEAAAEVERFSAWATSAGTSTAALYAKMIEAEQARFEDRHEEAERLYDDALRKATSEGVPVDIATVAGSYADALLAKGDLSRASAVIGQIGRFAENDFDCALLVTRLYHALGQGDVWRAALKQTRTLAGERSIPTNIATPPQDRMLSGPAPESP